MGLFWARFLIHRRLIMREKAAVNPPTAITREGEGG
jgi:hypothetical protein